MSTAPQPAATGHNPDFSLKNWDWTVVTAIGTCHVLTIYAFTEPQYFTWSGLALFAVFALLTGCIGITLCFHRLLTHRSFKTPKWFEYVLTTCGCLAWQGGPMQWVGVHRIHHAESDKELDPHSPKHGFTWAHMLWCMLKNPVNHLSAMDATKDMAKDPFTRKMNDLFFIPQVILIGALFGLGWWAGGVNLAVSWILWGVAVRTVFVYHVTWFVNSASHTWGYRNYETDDHSTNLWWVGILSFGEGWHNNHHAMQSSARHGLRWYEVDLTYAIIVMLSKVGLAKDIKVPSPEQMPTQPLKAGPVKINSRSQADIEAAKQNAAAKQQQREPVGV